LLCFLKGLFHTFPKALGEDFLHFFPDLSIIIISFTDSPAGLVSGSGYGIRKTGHWSSAGPRKYGTNPGDPSA